jgi:hypothetical protein
MPTAMHPASGGAIGEGDEPMDDMDSEWRRKGATLSDKTAREELGLTQDEIVRAIRAGKLQWREASMHGKRDLDQDGVGWLCFP